jgi:hypothetical protein
MSRVLLIGLGDLGMRIATNIVRDARVHDLILAAREHAAPRAALVADCADRAHVRFVPVDALNVSALQVLLRRERPDLLVQCASLLSPWVIAERTDTVARRLQVAGFAAQLPAHLAIVQAVMLAVREVGLTCPVVNCSYPDLTHPVLAASGLAPTIGTGNVGMIARRVRTALRTCDAGERQLVRVLAHHVHVTGCVLSCRPSGGASGPQVYLGESGDRADHLAYAAPPLKSNRTLNALSAATAGTVLAALLDGDGALRTSAPGPLGLPGGYPVRIAACEVTLDLPPSLPLEDAVAYQQQCARWDGVERIERDGTVFFTDVFSDTVAPLDPELAKPLSPDDALKRFSSLQQALANAPD